MPGKTLDILDVIKPDSLGTEIARNWHTWNMLRQNKVDEWIELRKYLYATDTTKTSNSKLPWKNTTTLPKLCQISDNLIANYMATIFPKKKSFKWDADDRSSNTKEKKDAISKYMCYVTGQKEFKDEMRKCIQDFVHFGNVFGMPDWVDNRVEVQDKSGKTQVGYIGPAARRVSPLDIVFNPVAESFERSPKIVRSLVSIGEVKEILNRLSDDTNRKEYEELYQYLKDYRARLQASSGDDLTFKNEAFRIDGFGNYHQYINGNYAEILTFYGDLYDQENDVFLKNHIIMVVDRHKVISKKPNPSYFGKPPIHHVGWRTRQDNLWAMGPLDNLIGMQYRIDHVENLKADVFDLITFPPLKVKGYVQDFEWGPFTRIITDEEGDVEMLAPPWNVLTTNVEIQSYMNHMEELAGSPKEAMGFRTPGEKTKYEVQRLENAASRIFQSKISQFEEQFLEPLLNSMLELAKRLVTSDVLVKYFDDDLKVTRFLDLTPEDITGEGRIRPYAARHFAEQAELVQNLSNFFQSPLGMDPAIKAHFSSIKLSKLFEELFDIEDYNIVMPYVRMAEEADAQRIANAQQEMVMSEALQAAGLTEEDVQAAMPTPNVPQEQAPVATSPFTQGQGFPTGAGGPSY